MMLGFLLARAGIEVTVLEKHADFLRDFRGDTVHPSTLEIMHELGLLEEFLTLPHQKTYQISATIGEDSLPMADFSTLKLHAPYIAFMPQWDFLNFLAKKASIYKNFTLMMEAEVTDIITSGDKITGINAITPEGILHVQSNLVIAADGRHSTLRNRANLAVKDYGAPIDVLWFRLSRTAADPDQTQGRILTGSMMVMINRGDYWQCAYIIRKGYFDNIKLEGLQAFHHHIQKHAPFLRERVHEITDWQQVKLLTVTLDYLTQWHKDGLLCIGDAAHAMSPVGGVGINLAIQDAVATANIIGDALKQHSLTLEQLSQVQKRRHWPTRMTQRLQLRIHKRIICRVLNADRPLHPPLLLKWASKLPWFTRFMGRLIGIGFRSEHIKR